MIYTDGVHLVTDEDLYKLHIFAAGIGFRCSWFQNGGRFPHYDLTTIRKMKQAIDSGAIRS